jgi:predicted ATPase
MIKSLRLENFTAFSDATFEFGKGFNVIVGENGLGKTHVLKAAYTMLAVNAESRRDLVSDAPTATYLHFKTASKLRAVFRPDHLRHLVRGKTSRFCAKASFSDSRFDFGFSFSGSDESVNIVFAPSAALEKAPVYLPTRELLTIYPGFASLYETTHLPFEETWRDTAILLGAPLLREQRGETIRGLLKPLEDAMDGVVELDSSGRFYLKTGGARREMHLVAEGLNKLAMIARLIANGSLTESGYLFWDEPEANLNPKLVKVVARTIVGLSRRGIQIFIATHSLFLLRELYILQQEGREKLDVRFFGLHLENGAAQVMAGKTPDDIGDITALDEELMQSNRYLEIENELAKVE